MLTEQEEARLNKLRGLDLDMFEWAELNKLLDKKHRRSFWDWLRGTPLMTEQDEARLKELVELGGANKWTTYEFAEVSELSTKKYKRSFRDELRDVFYFICLIVMLIVAAYMYGVVDFVSALYKLAVIVLGD